MRFSAAFVLAALPFVLAAGNRGAGKGAAKGAVAAKGAAAAAAAAKPAAGAAAAKAATGATAAKGAVAAAAAPAAAAPVAAAAAAAASVAPGTAPPLVGAPATADSTDPQTSTILNPKVIATGFTNNGQAVQEAGQVASATSNNNFINFCLTHPNLPITNGQQIKTGSCNPAPMGVIAATTNMPSSKFVFPKNNDASLKPNTAFTIQMAINNLETGNFVNANQNYYSAPQNINAQGLVIGHSHVAIESLTSLQQTTPSNPNIFAFFKGINTPAVNGIVTVDVTAGLPAGFYKMCSINAAANHQPVLVAVAQHASLDDCSYFTVGNGGGGTEVIESTTAAPAATAAAVAAKITGAAAAPAVAAPPAAAAAKGAAAAAAGAKAAGAAKGAVAAKGAAAAGAKPAAAAAKPAAPAAGAKKGGFQFGGQQGGRKGGRRLAREMY